jgi:hypothetical protein
VGINTGVEQVRRERMVQGMETGAVGDTRPSSGLVLNLLGGARGHGLVGFGAGEAPGLGFLDLPIGPQFDQEAFGQQAVAVFVALTLIDADEHATRSAVDIAKLEPNHFADAQASRIRGHQEGTVFDIAGGGKEMLQLFDTEHTGQVLWGGSRGQVEFGCDRLTSELLCRNR